MQKVIQDILQCLEQYFVYLYPGFVTIFIYSFTKAKGFKLNKTLIVLSVIISYLYVLIYRFIRGINEIASFKIYDYIIILIISIVLPFIWNFISKAKWMEKILHKLNINTTIETNVWDYIHNRDKDKKGIILKVFLDDKDIMYEGSLRYHESDKKKEQTICLSGYRRYVKENGKFVVKQDYNGDNSRWVLIKMCDVTRTEIMYDSEK